ncbi:hypothetical protein [Dietzia aurantiaca]|uniref:Uncharacterized protein n=1 Tax=Dietzia aurantiaca TaxID=983873 RepID=A0ABV9PRM8_9ACTN
MKTGTRMYSQACEGEVMVIKGVDVELACGGVPMSDAAGDSGSGVADGFDGGTVLGKRYQDEESGLQVLCVKPGSGSLSVDGRILPEMVAKQLPSSD